MSENNNINNHEYYLKVENSDSENMENALIKFPISEDDIENVDNFWVYYMDDEEDKDWKWTELVNSHVHGNGYRQYSIRRNDRCEGLMLVQDRANMRTPSNSFQEGCYICYLAVAPWNRKELRERREFDRARSSPVGPLLVYQAINWSIAMGFDGRIGLHSKPRAETSYEGMFGEGARLGPDEAEGGLVWFDITPEAAAKFVDRLFERGYVVVLK